MIATAAPRFYGRRKGKRLRPGQETLLRELLPRLAVPLPASGAALDPRDLFAAHPETAGPEPAHPEPIWLEIGFGGGEHLAALAAQHPEIGFIGCEPFIAGIVKLLAAIARDGLANIRLYPDDARLLLARLRPASLGRVFMLFPDPWPKTRHHKRRLVAAETLDALARAMRPQAELRLATDDPGLRDWMLEQCAAHSTFESAGIFASRPADWPATRYEAKARARGVPCSYLIYRRSAAGG